MLKQMFLKKKSTLETKHFVKGLETLCILPGSVIKCQLLSHVQLFETPWTAAHQAPLSTEFFRQEYRSGWPFPSLGDLLDPGIEPGYPTSQAFFFFNQLSHKAGPQMQIKYNPLVMQYSEVLSENILSIFLFEGKFLH